MATAQVKPSLVEKEVIPRFNFPNRDVLVSPEELKKRKRDAEYAAELGNLAQYKVAILFEDGERMKKVKTTIWNVTKKDVILKHRIKIPINRIHKIIFE